MALVFPTKTANACGPESINRYWLLLPLNSSFIKDHLRYISSRFPEKTANPCESKSINQYWRLLPFNSSFIKDDLKYVGSRFPNENRQSLRVKIHQSLLAPDAFQFFLYKRRPKVHWLSLSQRNPPILADQNPSIVTGSCCPSTLLL